MQNVLPLSVVSSLSIVMLLTPSLARALNIGDLEFGIQPRIEAGLMYYEYEQDAVASAQLANPTTGTPNTTFSQSKLIFKDVLPVVGGGITFFIDRFFIDFSAQKAFSGDDNNSQSRATSEFDVSSPTFPTSFSEVRQTRFDADFDRTEYAISLGYSIPLDEKGRQQLAVFAGYKRAKTDFDNVKGTGRFNQGIALRPGSNNELVSGDVTSDADFDFDYDGPFVGLTYGLDVRKFRGFLTFKFAAAFLDGEVDSNVNETFIFDNPDDPANRLVTESETKLNSDGDTLGLTFGIKWGGLIKRGLIQQMDQLIYSINIDAYQYDFDADDSDDPDIKETAINFRFGLTYGF